jgi:hypothetical protein
MIPKKKPAFGITGTGFSLLHPHQDLSSIPMADGTGLAIGDFDIDTNVVQNKVEIMALQRVVDQLAKGNAVTPDMMETYRDEAIEQLNEEYPALGLEKK